MKIWIDESFVMKNKTGIGIYILTMEQALKSLNLKYDTFSFSIPEKLKFKFIFHILWLNTVFFIKTLIQKPDIIIFPNYIMPILKRKNSKYITVIHDLCILRNDLSFKSKIFHTIAINIAIKYADVIVTVSNTVKNELVDTYNILENRIKVINNSISEHFKNEEYYNENVINKYNIEKNKYILSVATCEKRKNLSQLIKAFELISKKHKNIKLVLVGKKGNINLETFTNFENIICTGYINDSEIPALYKNSLMYVFPSLYEGFGIPIIEAQYSGCPVLCSDMPVFREVAGKGAEYCIPDYIGIAEKMDKLICSKELRTELVIKGKENVKRFAVENIAEQIRKAVC